jgi:hypothetical protein
LTDRLIPTGRPLRSEPVRRDEVRFEVRFERQWLGGWQPRYELWTMPLGTFRNEVRQRVGWPAVAWFVGDPSLWRSLWDEVAANLVADYAGTLGDVYQAHPDFAARLEGWLSPAPELRVADVRQYICDYCGRGYVGIELRACPEITESAFERVKYRFTTEHPYHMLWW